MCNITSAVACGIIFFICNSAFAQENSDGTGTTPPATGQATTTMVPGSLPNPPVVLPGLTYTQDMIDRAIQLGKDGAKHGKSWDDLMKPYRQNPTWVSGKSGTVHESFVWIQNLDAMPVANEVWRAVKLYDPIKIDEFRKPGYVPRMLQFHAFLCSIPKPARGIIRPERAADPEDIKPMKFVLSDDQGNNIAAEENRAGDVKTGTTTFSGVEAVPTFGSGAVTVGGNTLYSSWTSTLFVPWSKNHPYYTAEYDVAFSLYDPKDNLVLSPNTKKITLRIITPTGEQDVTYSLVK